MRTRCGLIDGAHPGGLRGQQNILIAVRPAPVEVVLHPACPGGFGLNSAFPGVLPRRPRGQVCPVLHAARGIALFQHVDVPGRADRKIEDIEHARPAAAASVASKVRP